MLLELRSRTWHALAAPEDEIVRAQADMARSGLFGQPAAAVPLATLRQARAKGIDPESALRASTHKLRDAVRAAELAEPES